MAAIYFARSAVCGTMRKRDGRRNDEQDLAFVICRVGYGHDLHGFGTGHAGNKVVLRILILAAEGRDAHVLQ